MPDRPRNRRGAVLVLVALCLGVLLALAGLVVDGGHVYLLRQRMQAGADAAVLAAAASIPSGRARMAEDAHRLAALNLPDAHDVAMNHPYDGDENRVEVYLTARCRPFFLGLLGHHELRVGTRAVATYRVGPVSTINPFAVNGLYGGLGVTITGDGVTTDSYESSRGEYGGENSAGRGNLVSGGAISVLGDRVDVRGNATAGLAYSQVGHETRLTGDVLAGDLVTLGGVLSPARVDGDVTSNGAIVAPGGSIGGSSTPDAGAEIPRVTLPPIDFSKPAARNDNAQIADRGFLDVSQGDPPSLVLAGDDPVLELPAGTYYFNAIVMSGRNPTIRANGPVTIYVRESVSMPGTNAAIDNLTRNPGSFVVLVGGTGAMTWVGTRDFHGGVYAPNAGAVTYAGPGQLFGKFVTGGAFTYAGTGGIHLDESLAVPFDGPVVLTYKLTE